MIESLVLVLSRTVRSAGLALLLVAAVAFISSARAAEAPAVPGCGDFSFPLAGLCGQGGTQEAWLPLDLERLLRVYAWTRIKTGEVSTGPLDLRHALEREYREVDLGMQSIRGALDASVTTKLDDEALLDAVICPGVLTRGGDCLGHRGILSSSGQDAQDLKRRVLEAARAIVVRSGKPCDEHCMPILENVVQAITWLGPWWAGLDAIVAGEPATCGSGASQQDCVRMVGRRLRDASGTWVALSALRDLTYPLPCLSPAQSAEWQRLAKVGASLGTPAPMDMPKMFADPERLKRLLSLAGEIEKAVAASRPALLACAQRSGEHLVKVATRQIGDRLPLIDSSRAPLACDSHDVRRGYLDFCNGSRNGFLGLRLRFPIPDGNREGPGCGTTASLSLLLHPTGASATEVVAIDSGVSEMELPTFCIASKRWAMLPFPRVRAMQVDRSALERSLRSWIPAPLNVAVDAVTFVPPAGKGQVGPVLKVQARVRVDGFVDDTPVQFDLQASRGPDPQRLFDTIGPRLIMALAKRLGVTIDGLGLLTPPACFHGTVPPAAEGTLYACFTPGFARGLAEGSLAAVLHIGAGSAVTLSLAPAAATEPLRTWLAGRLREALSSHPEDLRLQVDDLQLQGVRWRLALRLVGGAADGLVVSLQCALDDKDPLRTWHKQLAEQAGKLLEQIAQRALEEHEKRFRTELHALVDGALGKTLGLHLVSLQGRPLSAVVELQVPGLGGPVSVTLKSGVDVRKVLIQALQEGIDKKLPRTLHPAEGVEVEQPRIEIRPKGAGASVHLRGLLRLSKDPPVTVGISMSIVPLKAPEIDKDSLLTSQLTALFKWLSISGWAIGGSDASADNRKVELAFDGMMPVLSVPISAKMILGPGFVLEGAATVALRPDTPPRIQKLEIGCRGSLCWFPSGPGLMIGHPRGSVDFSKPSNFSLSATLTFAPGDGPDRLTRFDGTLSYDTGHLRVDADLYVAQAKTGHSVGEWDFQQGTVTLDTTFSAAGLPVPMPSLNSILDGQHCVLASGAQGNLLGLANVKVASGLRVVASGGCSQDASSGLASRRNELKTILELCGALGQIPVAVCGGGDVSILGVQGHANFAMPMLLPGAPTGNANFKLRVLGMDIEIDARLRPHFASLEARLPLIKLTVLVPGIESIDQQTLIRIIEDALRPSLDLDALLRRDIVVSLIPPSSGAPESDASASGGTGSNAVQPARRAQPSQSNGGNPASDTASEGGRPASGADQAPGHGEASAGSVGTPPGAPSEAGNVTTRYHKGFPLQAQCDGDGILGRVRNGPVNRIVSCSNARLLLGKPTAVQFVDPGKEEPAPTLKLPELLAPPREWANSRFGGWSGIFALEGTMAACDPAACSYNALHLIPFVDDEDGAKASSLPDLESPAPTRDLGKVSDGIFDGTIDHAPEMLGVYRLLASKLAWHEDLPTVTCLVMKEGRCVSALLEIGDAMGVSIAGLYDFPKFVDPPMRKLIKQICSQGCSRDAAGQRALDQFTFVDQLLIARYFETAGQLWALAEAPWPALNAVAPIPRTFQALFPLPADSTTRPVVLELQAGCHSSPARCQPVIQRLLPSIMSTDRATDTRWVIKTSTDAGGPKYFAGYLDGPSPLVFAAIRRGDKWSLQVRPWSEIQGRLVEWRGSGLLSGQGPSSARDLADLLTRPRSFPDGFHRNPLLLFGDSILKVTE